MRRQVTKDLGSTPEYHCRSHAVMCESYHRLHTKSFDVGTRGIAAIRFNVPFAERWRKTQEWAGVSYRHTEAMVKANDLARSRLKTYQKRLKKDYDLRVRLRSFTAEQMVYLFNSTAVKGVSRKLVKYLKGSGVVLQRITPALYLVKTKQDTHVVHHDKMRLCKDRITPSWARQF